MKILLIIHLTIYKIYIKNYIKKINNYNNVNNNLSNIILLMYHNINKNITDSEFIDLIIILLDRNIFIFFHQIIIKFLIFSFYISYSFKYLLLI